MTKQKIIARIDEVETRKGKDYWIIIEHKNKPIENTMMAITKDEILPIKLACERYLEDKQ